MYNLTMKVMAALALLAQMAVPAVAQDFRSFDGYTLRACN